MAVMSTMIAVMTTATPDTGKQASYPGAGSAFGAGEADQYFVSSRIGDAGDLHAPAQPESMFHDLRLLLDTISFEWPTGLE